jgi:UPF0716 protein FxsA
MVGLTAISRCPVPHYSVWHPILAPMGILFLLLLVIPIAELYVIVQVADAVGFFETLVLLIGISIGGAYLLKQQGLATWVRFQDALAHGEIPARHVTDGALILLGGALLLTPGFLTDIVGLVLLLPPTRAVIKSASRRLLGRWAARRFVPGGARIYTAGVTRTKRTYHDDPSRRPGESPELRPGEDDSRDS